MIVTTLIAATVAAQAVPAPQPIPSPAPIAEKQMACCEKMTKGEGCACCKHEAKEHHDAEGMNNH
jgi:hypothetical protein